MSNRNPDGTFTQGNTEGNRWKKGQSGNPDGWSTKAEMMRQLKEKLKNGKTVHEMIVGKHILKALDGDMVAIKDLWDRIDGKPQQKIDMNVTEETEWELEVVAPDGEEEEES
jgi:hypothetical protein